MSKQLEFFFDYVSPTAYLAHSLAPRVAERTGAELVYRPFFLGGVMQATGNRPPGTVASKGAYMQNDLRRCARRAGVPFFMNRHFPMNTRGLTRATIGLDEDSDARDRFIDACFRYCYGIDQPFDPADPVDLKRMCDAEGFGFERIVALGEAPKNKDKLRANTEEAVSRGVFGAPSFFVGDELFFGHDRLDYVEEALGARVPQAEHT
jgi:2-hydroxychromene-2-carboxylate isomerase